MFLNLIRDKFTENSTIGKLYVEGNFECYTLEDTCREHPDIKAKFEIAYEKILGKTAIPAGKYNIIITYSNRFKRYLPLLENVPGFEGIRIHSGNTSYDTEGCILVGKINDREDWIGESKLALDNLYKKIEAALDNYEDVYIKIDNKFDEH